MMIFLMVWFWFPIQTVVGFQFKSLFDKSMMSSPPPQDFEAKNSIVPSFYIYLINSKQSSQMTKLQKAISHES